MRSAAQRLLASAASRHVQQQVCIAGNSLLSCTRNLGLAAR